MHTAAKTFDDDLALEQAGGNAELARELFTMLLKELPQFDRALRAAHERHDHETLQRTIHKLNGAATYCGVPALREGAAYLEHLLKRRHLDQVDGQLAIVLAEIRKVQEQAHVRLG